MSSGAQVELDWAGIDAGRGGAGAPAAGGANGAGGGAGGPLTDEEILGIDSPSPNGGFGEQARENAAESVGTRLTENNLRERQAVPPRGDTTGAATLAMPEWMQALGADPRHASEARQLWQEHQAFRAAFSSPEEARAIKEMFPGGAQEALALREAAREVESLRQGAESLREAAQAVERIDAAIYSGDARAQSEVVAELARANPAAFRAMFAEAAKVLGEMGGSGGREAGGTRQGTTTDPPFPPRRTKDGAPGTGQASPVTDHQSLVTNHPSPGTGQSSHAPGTYAPRRQDAGATSPDTNHESRITNHAFDPAAYAAFERSTNDAVARDVRGAVSETLARVLPEGIAEGAARRIGEDIFNEIHRALAADRALSEQVAEVLRGSRTEFTASGSPREFAPGGWRFGMAEQQRVASLLAGRARQIVPGVARRVVGEWTSSVLGASRSKAARQAAAASRVDIAAPGGSQDSMPLRPMSRREVNYAAMSDDQILGM